MSEIHPGDPTWFGDPTRKMLLAWHVIYVMTEAMSEIHPGDPTWFGDPTREMLLAWHVIYVMTDLIGRK